MSQDREWMTDAVCATTDPSLFFPKVGDNAAGARLICSTCPVAGQCLDYAIANEFTEGIFGGLTPNEGCQPPIELAGIVIGPKVPKPSKADESEAYELVTLRDSNACVRCRGHCGPVQRDHRRNRSQGGLTVVANLQCLGLDCHEWKTTHPKDAADQGFAVPGWVFWEEWPARRWVWGPQGFLIQRWVLYDNTGGWDVITDEEAQYRISGGVPF